MLWRPNFPTYPLRAKKAKWTAILWVLSYVAGVIDFLLRTIFS